MQLMGTSFHSFQLSHDAGKDGEDAFGYAEHDPGEDAFKYAEHDAGKVCEQTLLQAGSSKLGSDFDFLPETRP